MAAKTSARTIHYKYRLRDLVSENVFRGLLRIENVLEVNLKSEAIL